MMLRLFWILPLLIAAPAPAQSPAGDELLRRGLELELQGKPGAALELWQQAAAELEVPSLAIATEYLRVATEHELDEYYRTATALYQWGTSAATEEAMAENRQALQQELERVAPLLEKGEAKRWRGLLEAGDPALFEHLRLFWELMDLTPATLYNERLIEHWQRIAWARSHFTRKDDPPYGTDARGLMYVKYGPPDRQAEGRLQAERGKVIPICKEMDKRCNEDLMAEVVFEMDPQPYYNIWVYNRPDREMQYNLTAIFGERPGGAFDRVTTLEDLIPPAAFTLGNRFNFASLRDPRKSIAPSTKVTPGMIIQYLYYEHLAGVDFFFAHRYSRFNKEFFQIDPSASQIKYQGYAQALESRGLTLENLNLAPAEISAEEKKLPEIPLEVYQYRLLDAENRPVFATFVESRPSGPFLSDLLANQDVMYHAGEEGDELSTEQVFGYYRLSHGLQLRDGRGKLLSQARRQPPLVIDPEGDSPSHSVFVIPHVADKQVSQLFYAELENFHPETTPSAGSLFPDQLRGLGRSTVPSPSRCARTQTGW